MKNLNLNLNLNLILILLLFCLPVALFAQSEEEAVKKVVQEAYIDAMQNLGDLKKARQGFHPDFEMLLFRDGQMSKLPIGTWIERIEQRKANPATTPPNITGKFINVEITGTVAMVKLELHRDGKRIFTDYISLYKFEDGWKVVSKVYYQH